MGVRCFHLSPGLQTAAFLHACGTETLRPDNSLEKAPCIGREPPPLVYEASTKGSAGFSQIPGTPPASPGPQWDVWRVL